MAKKILLIIISVSGIYTQKFVKVYSKKIHLLIMQDNSNKTGNQPRNQTRSILTPSRLFDELLESEPETDADNMS